MIKKRIGEVEASSGTICPDCEQEITAEHAAELCVPYKKELADREAIVAKLTKEVAALKKRHDAIKVVRPQMSLTEVQRARQRVGARDKDIENTQQKIAKATTEIANTQRQRAAILKQVEGAKTALEKSKPKTTVEACEAVVAQYQSLRREIENTQKSITALKTKKNPYAQLIKSLKADLAKKQAEVQSYDEERRTLDILFGHFKYIHKSYADRRNIKKWLLDDLIPFLNKRIHYYLDSFGVDLHLSFTSTLGDEMEKWDYELCSGGERKRIDLAIMFGLYDLHLAIYGPQCNVMILDEVDGKLDDKGVRAFTDVILTDFSGQTDKPRPETILVVSHKTAMRAAFPTQILIRKEDGFSTIAAVTT
jgi:DNA repair exonuclease SbcCD ATPase subunit